VLSCPVGKVSGVAILKTVGEESHSKTVGEESHSKTVGEESHSKTVCAVLLLLLIATEDCRQ
jgi:hypothetical protein